MNRITIIGLAACLLVPTNAISAAPKRIALDPSTTFLKLPKGLTMGSCSAVAIDSKQNIYVFHRGKQPILVFSKTGKFLRSWGDKLIAYAHGLRIDKQGNVWVTDTKRHQVFKFSSKGKLLMTLGTANVPGTGKNQFDKPTDIAFGANGDLYISDGYGNSRVVVLTSKGKFIRSWGTAGRKPKQFDTPHTILVDRKGRVIVGDRENDRVQVFNSKGKLLAIWPGFAPFGLAFDGDGNILVADGRAHAVLRLSSAGKVVQIYGKKGKGPGEFNLPHMLATDANGNVYVAEIGNNRLQKLSPRK